MRVIIRGMKVISRVWHILQSSLRWKVTLGLVLPLILTMGILFYLDYTRLYRAMLKDLSVVVSQSGQLIEQNLRQQMVKMDFVSMQQMLDTISSNQGFQAIYLLDRNGKIIFSPSSEGVGRRLSNAQTDCQPCHKLDAASRPPSVMVDLPGEVRIFRTMQAIRNGPTCIKCHDAAQPIIGLLLIDVPTAPFEASVQEQLQEHLFWWLGTVVVVVFMINLTLNRFILLRLEVYLNTLRRAGKQSMPTLKVYSHDELGTLAEAFNTMSQQVEQRNTENKILSEDLRRQVDQRGELLKRIISAQEDERKRVARELHDEFGTSLGSLALQTEAVRRFLDSDPGRAKEQIEQIKKLIVNTTDNMYDLILALRPSALDDLGFKVALYSLAERAFGSAGIQFQIDTAEMQERLPKEIETPLYRVFQEAFSNIVRHSGASKVKIRVMKNAEVFEGLIEDNGTGFDLPAVPLNGLDIHGLGLLGMQERITQCGGTIQIETAPGRGTSLHILIPLTGFSND